MRSSDASPGRALRPETEIIHSLVVYERRSRQSETRIKNNVRRDRERVSERGKSPNAPNAPHLRSKEGFYRRGEEKTRTIAVIRFFSLYHSHFGAFENSNCYGVAKNNPNVEEWDGLLLYR